MADSNQYGGPADTIKSGEGGLTPPYLLCKGPSPDPCRDNYAREGDIAAPMPLGTAARPTPVPRGTGGNGGNGERNGERKY